MRKIVFFDTVLFMDGEIKKRVDTWLNGPYDSETKEEILKLSPQELQDAFYTDLSFGTAGLRGIMGVGTTRMNIYTVTMATQGLSNYILKQKGQHRVLIGYDSRHNSLLFAQKTAQVLAANGIEALLLKELRPVPFVSFGTRYRKCTAGVMITASHNPKEYNGYKVYWSDGAQIVPPHDIGIMEEVRAIKDFSEVKLVRLSHPNIHIINGELDEAYINAIRPLQHFPEDNKKEGSSVKIVYTSLHGTGITMVPKALNDWGFTSISYVEEQIKPDGDFPTVKFPNPEYKEATALGIEYLDKTGSDILIATDPDADRIGIVVKHQGKAVALTGNEMASICAEFICENTKLPSNGAIVTTIVSTEILKAVAKAHNVACVEVLTGFKYIGEKIHIWEQTKEYTFLFGAEESYGCLLGTVARDKDSIVAACLISEITLHAKKQGLTLIDLLNQIYKKYGFYREKQVSLSFPAGEEGMTKISAIMDKLRKSPLKDATCEDYQKGIRDLPPSNVLIFRFQDDAKLIIRPSGTEPKIKLYVSAHGTSEKACDDRLEELVKCIDLH